MAVAKSAKVVKTSTPVSKTTTPAKATVAPKPVTQAVPASIAAAQKSTAVPASITTLQTGQNKSTSYTQAPKEKVTATAMTTAQKAQYSPVAGMNKAVAPVTPTPAKTTAPAVSTVSKSTGKGGAGISIPSPKPVVSQTVSPTVSTAGAVKSATNNLINAKDDLNRAQIASSVAKAPSANVNPETIKKIEQNVVTSKENLAVAKQQAVNVGINPDNVSPYKFTPPTAAGIQQTYQATGKSDIQSAIESGVVNTPENQPTFDMGEYTSGEPTGVQVTADELRKQAESYILQSDPETGAVYYVASDGTVLTQEQYQSMLGRIEQAFAVASQSGGGGLRFGTVSPADYTGAGAVGMPTEQTVTVYPTNGVLTGREVANYSDSNNVTATGTGTTSLDPIAGSTQNGMAMLAPSGVYGDQGFFSNPYLEKLSQMQFDYDPSNDPEYLNNSAILENAVTQAMVGRGGMYSSVYQSALSSKLIELQIGMRKAKYDQFVDERAFMLNMAKTTFDMQMSVANYNMDYNKMLFDQEMTVRKYEADRADAEFSKQMQRNEYAMSVAKYNQQLEKDNAYSTLMTDSEKYKYDKTQQERLLTAWKTNKVANLEIASFFGVPLNTSFNSTGAVKAYSSKASQLSTMQKSIVDRSTALGDYETLQLALNDFVIPSSKSTYGGTSADNSSPDQLVSTTSVLSSIKDSASAFKVERAIESNPTMYYNQLGFYGYQQVLKRIDDMTSGLRG